jgi:hypothetical protein
MTPNQLAVLYMGALQMADLERILALFAPDGVVHSPLYGPTPAVDYYPELFRDTSRSDLTLRGVSSGVSVDGGGIVMIWFNYDWQFTSGQQVPFEVVDVLELNAEGRIAHLHIVYDTVDTRPAMEQETGRRSWRMAGAEQ